MKNCKAIQQQKLKNLAQNHFVKYLEHDETLLLLTPIEKFDEEGQDYPCILAVSNKCVYDYVNTEMTSRVPADRVRAVTVSKMGNEFIMHVPDGVDCRYDHPDKEQIIEVLNKLHRSFYKGQPIMMFFRDDITLENYTALSPKVRQQLDPEIEHFNLYQDHFEPKGSFYLYSMSSSEFFRDISINERFHIA